MIDIKPNGNQRPNGTGPSGDYFLMVRRNGVAYYTRTFDKNEAANGTQRDLAMPARELKPDDKLTVAVENVNRQNPSDYVRLSNILDIPPPAPSAPSFAIPKSNVTK